MSTPWRLLNPTPSDTRLPPLLISTTFTSNSYTVNITDLTYIWGESLDRRGIIKRSLDEDTSIDPSEDAEQLRVFLDKVQSALSGAAKTSLSLRAISKRGSKEPPNLDIYITAELPRGLKPLEWPFHLTLLPQSELSTRLTIPILRAQNAKMRELDRLVEMLKEKDHVIQKLVDKLEVMGTELGHVFPGLTGKGGRKVSREVAEQRIKGLGTFEVEDWKREMRLMEKADGNEDIKVAVKHVYEESSSLLLNPILQVDGAGKWVQWFDAAIENPIKISDTTGDQETKTGNAKVFNEREKDEETTKDDEDDFQVQATPPQLRAGTANSSQAASSPPTLRSQAVIQDSTDDEDDLDAPSQRSIVPDSVPLIMPNQQPRKLGTIGRPTATTATAPPPPAPGPARVNPTKTKNPIPPANQNGRHIIPDDEETASEDDGVPSPARSPTPPPPPPQQPKITSPAPAKAKKSGLGKIGGKAREATPPLTKAAKGEDISPAQPLNKPKPKLGVIGHKPVPHHPPTLELNGDDDNDGDQKKNVSRGRSTEVAAASSSTTSMARREREDEEQQRERETSRERADRKRAELKRMLEEKAKGPVKKKRKF